MNVFNALLRNCYKVIKRLESRLFVYTWVLKEDQFIHYSSNNLLRSNSEIDCNYELLNSNLSIHLLFTDTEKRNGGSSLLSVTEHLYTKVACPDIKEENEEDNRRWESYFFLRYHSPVSHSTKWFKYFFGKNDQF